MRQSIALLCLLASLAGCANITPSASAIDTAAANEPLYCEGAQQCSDYWKRAQVWVASNSTYRMQLASDSVITTFGPRNGDLNFAFQVTREPQGGGREQIRIAMACGNMFGCRSNRDTVTAAFKAYVAAGTP